MMESSKRDDEKLKVNEVEIFFVPFVLNEKYDNSTITTNNHLKINKEQIISQAINFHLQGNILEAKKYYKQLINQGCNDQSVFCNYGTILQKLGNLKEAVFPPTDKEIDTCNFLRKNTFSNASWFENLH